MQHEGRTISVLCLLLALAVVFSPVAAGAGGSSVSVPSSSPALDVAAESTAPGQASNVSVGYNVTGVVSESDLQLYALNDTQGSLWFNASLNATEGTKNFSIDPHAAGGDRRIAVQAYNNSTHTVNESAVVTANVSSPVVIDDYATSTTSVETGEQFVVNATLNNTDGAAEAEFRLAVYPADGDHEAMNNTTVTVSAGATKAVNLTVAYGIEYGDTASNLTVNDEPATAMTVSSGGDGGSSTWSTVSAGNATVPVGESGTVAVGYDLADDQDPADAVLELENASATLDTNASLADNGTAELTVPARSIAGPRRLSVVLRNSTSDETLAPTAALNLSVAGNVSIESATVPDSAVSSSGENVTVTLKNAGSTAERFRLSPYDDATSRHPAGHEYVQVPGGATATYNVTTTYGVGTRTTYFGNESYGTTVVSPAATVESVEYVSGPENTTALDASVRGGSLLTAELRNGTDQDLAPAGATENTTYRMVLRVNHSVEPGLAVANARDVTWTVVNRSDHYEVTIEGRPLESQFMYDAPDLDNWDSLSDSEDRADDELLWFSVSFVDEGALHNGNMSGMTIATDAQTFGSPRYDAADESLEIDLAAAHYTVDGEQNAGIYQATVPSAMLDQWGIEDADDLAGSYDGESRTVTASTNSDGSLDVAMDIHYSSGTVSLEPSDDGGSTGGVVVVSSDDSDDGTTDDGTTDGDSTDGGSVGDNATDGRQSSAERRAIAAITGAESSAVAVDGDRTEVTLTNATANGTISIDLAAAANATAADGDASVGNGTAGNASAGNASVGNASAGSGSGGDGAPAVSGLDLNLSRDAPELGVSVGASGEAPDGTPALSLAGGASADAADGGSGEDENRRGDAVGYLSIDLSGSSDEDVENATISFSVPADRLAELNTSAEDVRLYRYHDGEWRALETRHLGGDDYVAETPGFSVFAVATDNRTDANGSAATATPESTAVGATATAGSPAEETTADGTATTAEPTEGTTAQPTTATDAPGFGALPALVAVLAVAHLARRRD